MAIRLGFQISQLDVGYSRKLVEGLRSFRGSEDISLYIFHGRSAQWPYGYEYQHTAIYEHLSSRNLDALIIASGTQTNYISLEAFHDSIKRLAPLPVVSIAVPIPGIPSVRIDSRKGLWDLLEHLADKHNRKHFAILAGSDRNIESYERFEVFRSFLNERGLPFDTSLVVKSDFSGEGVGETLDKVIGQRCPRFDTLIALNDAMAMAAIRHLRARSYRVPEDISVTGFDDVEEGRVEYPSLTTVSQSLLEQAQTAARIALDMVAGKKVPQDSVLPTRLVIRESCGCIQPAGIVLDPSHVPVQIQSPPPRASAELAKLITACETDAYDDFIRCFDTMVMKDIGSLDDFTNRHEALYRAYMDVLSTTMDKNLKRQIDLRYQGVRTLLGIRATNHIGRQYYGILQQIVKLQTFLAQLISITDLDELVRGLRDQLEAFEIKRCAVVVYAEPVFRDRDEASVLPDIAKVLFAYDQTGIRSMNTSFNPRRSMLPSDCFSLEPSTYIALALYHREEQFGYIVYEPGKIDSAIYEAICVQLAGTLKICSIFAAKHRVEFQLRNTMTELEQLNIKLSNLSLRDEMTGLYNRRGFLSLGGQSLELALRIGKKGMVIFCDLDGLKVINDTFGHEVGDRALMAAGDIIKKTFRSLDVVARLGGDEFTALAVDMNEDILKRLRYRLEQRIESYNKASCEPFLLSISMGAAEFSKDINLSLEALLASADGFLYEEKGRKGDRNKLVLRT